ncbi:MAG: c-type cytochrome [Chloroflexi bacterium]|nr:c-type cytochrome [Chloroflexota bacterium]
METIVAVAVAVAILILLVALLFIALGPRTRRVGTAEAVGGVPVPIDEGTAAGMPQKMILSVGMLVFTLLFMGGYWLTEPMRNQQAAQRQEHVAVERGIHAFAKYCARCHGDKGQGLTAPPLTRDAVAQRHQWDLSDPDKTKEATVFVYSTIYYGWPPAYRGQKPAMPNWGETAGGPLNYEQVNELVAFVLSTDEHKWEEVKKQVEAAGGLPTDAAPAAAAAGTPAEKGQATFLTKCVGCHAVDSLKDKGAVGTVGPNLSKFGGQSQIVGTLPTNEENVKKWLKDPPAVKSGTLMPNLGLSDDDINALAAFLLTLK